MADPHRDGEIIGRYRIVRTIARGGMGTTYEAEVVDGERRVALKELLLSRVSDWKVIELFEREARVLAALTHPSVPAYIDHFAVEGATGSTFYLVQELAPGQSLAQLVAGGWRADEAEARRIAEQLLLILDYLHTCVPPVFHRDIKPENVLREPSGKLWLVDFGAVRDVYRSTTVGGSTVAGTFGYMAPEQLHGVARPASDLYGLGATLLYVLSGESPAAMPQKKLKTEFRARVTVSEPFAAWLDKLIEPAPEDRFQAAREALKALRDRNALSRGATPSRKRLALLLSALGLITVAGGAFVGFTELRERRANRTGSASVLAESLPARPPDLSFPAVKWLRSFSGHINPVKDIAFTRDGSQLFTASFDGAVKEWDTRTGQTIRALPGHTGRVAGARVTRDGRFLVTGGDHTVRIWNVADGSPLRVIDAGPSQVTSLDVSASGKLVVSGDASGSARVWNFDGTPVTTLAHAPAGRVLSVSFSPDDASLVTAGEDKIAKVWSTADWKLHSTLAGHAGPVNQARVSPDGRVIASASDDRTVKLWPIDGGKPILSQTEHTDEVWALAFSPDGSTVVTGGKDSLLVISAFPSGALKQKWQLDAQRKVLGLAFSPDGSLLAAGYGDGVADLFQVSKAGTHAPLPVADLVERAPSPASASPEQKTYAEVMEALDTAGGTPGTLDHAKQLLDDLYKANPKSPLALAGLARVAFLSSRTRDRKYAPDGLATALDLAARAIAIDPKFPDPYCTRSAAAFDSKDAAGARAAAATALKLAPTMPRAINVALTVAMDDGDLTGAEKLLRDELSRPITRRAAASAFSALARLYRQVADVDAEEQADRRLVEVDPSSVAAKSSLASLLLYRRDYAGAIASAKQALSQSEYAAAKRTLAEAYAVQGEELLWGGGNVDGAGRNFRSAVGADPTSYRAAYDQGAWYQYDARARGHRASLAEAATWYGKAAALESDTTLAKLALAALGR